MSNNDRIFKKFIKYKKYKELLDFNSLESKISLIFSIIFCLLFYFILTTSTIDDINNITRALTKDVAIAILGLLGFLIAGLAILLSSITPNIVYNIKSYKKYNCLYSIFLGFYFEGLLIGFTILLLIIFHLSTYINWNINFNLFIIPAFLLSFLVIFILFYSISLIGNCISIFEIVNEYSNGNNASNTLSFEDKTLFNEIKLIVLEEILIIQPRDLDDDELLNEYINLFEDHINTLSNDDKQKERLLNYFSIIYRNS